VRDMIMSEYFQQGSVRLMFVNPG